MMALKTQPGERVQFDGRRSWLASVLNVPAILTLGLWALVRRYGSRYTVTNFRVYSRYGIMRKDEAIVQSADVRDVALSQSITSRLLGYGDVEVSTAGRGGSEVVFQGVSRPHRAREAVQGVIEAGGTD